MAGKGRPGPAPSGNDMLKVGVSLNRKQVEWLHLTARLNCGPFGNPSTSAVLRSLIDKEMSK